MIESPNCGAAGSPAAGELPVVFGFWTFGNSGLLGFWKFWAFGLLGVVRYARKISSTAAGLQGCIADSAIQEKVK